ncbi:HTTM domain-containing protein [Streptomyces sp. B6B3]|uniref:HTTM domain-containing protein n=1 Tax=Streptomyces sp. B6B3 TaxID=3153570 RepID=UPI00325E3268
MPPTPPAPPAPAVPPSPFRDLGARFDASLGRGVGHVTRRPLGPYQTAVVRIGFAVTMLVFLLREWPHRHELYGPDSPWGFDLATLFVDDNDAFTVLLWTDSTAWFEFVYLLALASCVGLALGWRTRAMSLLFMIGVLSLQNRSVFMGDGGDNVIHLMSLYLVLTRCGQVWSLDARRRARGRGHWADPGGVATWAVLGSALLVSVLVGKLDSPIWTAFFAGMWLVHAFWWFVERYAGGEPRIVADVIANLVHNAALLVIMVQVCVIYAAAGWYKIQGSRWQDGTAVYYPLNLDYFEPWPELSDMLSNSGLLIAVLSYGTVAVQVAFPFALLNRRAKNLLLFLMIGEHIGIAVTLGLPAFSMAMIAMDSVFLPTAFLLWTGSRVRRGTAPLRRLLGRSSPAPDAAGGPWEQGPAPGAPVPAPRDPARPPAWAERP